ncbi:hypothetical protein Tco_1246985 [Tanacetum coccineum]
MPAANASIADFPEGKVGGCDTLRDGGEPMLEKHCRCTMELVLEQPVDDSHWCICITHHCASCTQVTTGEATRLDVTSIGSSEVAYVAGAGKNAQAVAESARAFARILLKKKMAMLVIRGVINFISQGMDVFSLRVEGLLGKQVVKHVLWGCCEGDAFGIVGKEEAVELVARFLCELQSFGNRCEGPGVPFWGGVGWGLRGVAGNKWERSGSEVLGSLKRGGLGWERRRRRGRRGIVEGSGWCGGRGGGGRVGVGGWGGKRGKDESGIADEEGHWGGWAGKAVGESKLGGGGEEGSGGYTEGEGAGRRGGEGVQVGACGGWWPRREGGGVYGGGEGGLKRKRGGGWRGGGGGARTLWGELGQVAREAGGVSGFWERGGEEEVRDGWGWSGGGVGTGRYRVRGSEGSGGGLGGEGGGAVGAGWG